MKLKYKTVIDDSERPLNLVRGHVFASVIIKFGGEFDLFSFPTSDCVDVTACWDALSKQDSQIFGLEDKRTRAHMQIKMNAND